MSWSGLTTVLFMFLLIFYVSGLRFDPNVRKLAASEPANDSVPPAQVSPLPNPASVAEKLDPKNNGSEKSSGNSSVSINDNLSSNTTSPNATVPMSPPTLDQTNNQTNNEKNDGEKKWSPSQEDGIGKKPNPPSQGEGIDKKSSPPEGKEEIDKKENPLKGDEIDKKLSPSEGKETDKKPSPPEEKETEKKLSPPEEKENDKKLSPPEEKKTDEKLSPPEDREADKKLSPPEDKEEDRKPSPPAQIVENCDGKEKKCQIQNTFTGCIRNFGLDSKELEILVQNDGQENLKVSIIVPASAIDDKKDVVLLKHQITKVNISNIIGKSSKIILSTGNKDCEINIESPLPELNALFHLPTTDQLLTPINGAYFLILTVITFGGVWACCKFIKQRRHGSVPYQELEMATPETAAINVETAEGWDQGWDDDWNEENSVKSPVVRLHTGNISANGLTSRPANRDGWENDWDD